MGVVKFIHVSDVHLGHQQFNLEHRFLDFGQAFRQVIDKALEEKVDFIIIGGDFFHKRAIDAETLRQAMELLEPLRQAEIPVIAIEGNHDKAFYQEKSSWLNLLNSLGYLRLLKPQFHEGKPVFTKWSREASGCVTEVAGVQIIGLGYLGATTAHRLSELGQEHTFRAVAGESIDSRPFTIMVLHAAIDKLLGQDLGGVKKEVLEGFRGKVDYLALGHIHARQEIDDWVFNPGSLENCHIDEAKEGREKGFYLVTVEGHKKNVQYINSNPRKVALKSIDISGALNPGEVRERVLKEIRRTGLEEFDQPLLQLVLKGEIDFSSITIDIAALTREIKEVTGCLYVEIQNHANLPSQEVESINGCTKSRNEIESQVLKQLVRTHCPDFREQAEELADLILKIKDAALTGEPPEEILNEISKRAEALPDIASSPGLVAAAGESGEGGDIGENQEG